MLRGSERESSCRVIEKGANLTTPLNIHFSLYAQKGIEHAKAQIEEQLIEYFLNELQNSNNIVKILGFSSANKAQCTGMIVLQV